MAPVFCCGFECGIGSAHWTLTGAPAFSTSSPLAGARSLLCDPVVGEKNALTVATFSGGIWVFRFRVRFTTLPDVNTFVGIVAGSNAGAYFKQSDGKIYAGVSTAAFGATGVTVTTDVTYYIDVRVNSTGNPWLTDVSVSGAPCGQHSNSAGADTSAHGIFVGFGAGVTATARFDDVVLSLTSGDFPIGDGYINHFVPTSDSAHNIAGTADFRRTLTATDILNATTDAYQLVDDIPLESGAGVDWINMVAPPNAGDYVQCLFGPAPGISTPTTAPRAVEVIAGIHQAAAGAGNMEIRLNDNGTTNAVYSATGVAGVTSVAYKRKHYATAPTGGAWTLSGNGNFNNLKVQFGSPASLDVNPDQYFDCIMIEAEFAVGTPAVVIPHKLYLTGQAINRASNF